MMHLKKYAVRWLVAREKNWVDLGLYLRSSVRSSAKSLVKLSPKLPLKTFLFMCIALRGMGAIAYAPIGADDLAKDLLGDDIVTNIHELDNLHLEKAAAQVTPWSDNYWPYYRGSIAYRYADAGFPRSKSWGVNHQYFIDNEPLAIFKGGEQKAIDGLSPAEKYDLIMGDDTLAMTHYNWALGQVDFDKTSAVDQWMGICEGWSAASVYMPDARKPVRVLTPDGHFVTLSRSDIHALASLLWTKAAPKAKIIGGRCRTKTPAKDTNGRLLEAECFDSNPGTWHLVAANSLGIRNQSVIIDADYGVEVWNQPVFKYSFSYFNPETKAPATSLLRGLISIADFKHDKFAKYRAAAATSIVGVSMYASYIDETEPVADTSPHTKIRTVNYIYDLELDKTGEIIGGEWHSTLHPDFIWGAPMGQKAVSVGDTGLNLLDWQGGQPVPETWRKAAQQAIAFGQPLAVFVEKVIELSQ